MKKFGIFSLVVLILFFMIGIVFNNVYAQGEAKYDLANDKQITVNKDSIVDGVITVNQECNFYITYPGVAEITSISKASMIFGNIQNHVYTVEIKGKQKGITDIAVTDLDGKVMYIVQITVTNNVAGITLNESECEMTVGYEHDLIPTLRPSSPDNDKILWESDNNLVATVENGRVKAVGIGDVNIIAKTEDGGFTSSCKFTIIPKLEKFYMTRKYGQEINITDTSTEYILNCIFDPSDFKYQDVKYTSLDTNVVQVAENGKLRVISNGKTQINAELKFNGFTYRDTINVNVSGIVESINPSVSELNLTKPNETYKINYTINPTECINQKILFVSNNTDVVTVNENGLVTVIGEGSAQITLKTEDKKTYSKKYYQNGEFRTGFTSVDNGYIEISINVYEIKVVNDITTEYDEQTDSVIVKVTSNAGFQHTKPSWTLSEDRKTYSKLYNKNNIYEHLLQI